MAQHRPLSPTERLGWIVAGLGTGLLAGLFLGEWIGTTDGGRLTRSARRLVDRRTGPLSPSAAARAAQDVLHRDPALRDFGLEAVGAGTGIVALSGWVSHRALRARAARLVSAVPGINSLVNGILVRGEDDLPEEGNPGDHPEDEVLGAIPRDRPESA